MAQDLSSIIVAFKNQTGLGSPASGAGALGLELLPSQGFQSQIAQIASQLLSRSRMKARSRKGSEFYNWAGETELIAGASTGALMTAIANAIGGTWQPAQTLTEVDLTSVTISGGGTTLTFPAGNVIAEGVRVGMTAKFTGLATTGNNGKYFPILGISPNGRVLTIPSGILVDETADTAFSLVVSAAVYTDSPYNKEVVTMEHYLGDIDRSLLGSDFRFNGLNITVGADNMVKVSLAMGGIDLSMLESADSPNFTSPSFEEKESLVLLDGAIYFDTERRVDLASLNLDLQAPISGLPLISRRKSKDAFLGEFGLGGQFTGVIEDGAAFDSFKAEDQVSIYLHCAEQNADAEDEDDDRWKVPYVGIYAGNMSFGGWQMPAGGEGAAIQTVPMNGGRDKRGDANGYAATSLLISVPT